MGKPLVLVTGPPPERGYGIITHIRMLLASGLPDTYRIEQVELGGEAWHSSLTARVTRTPAQLLRFRRTVCERRPAIVHINTAPDVKAFLRDGAALWLVQAPGTKTVFEMHGGFERNTVFHAPGPLRAFARRTLRRASVVVTLDEYHTGMLERLCPGLPAVRAIPNFLEPEMMSALVNEPLGGGDGRLRALFISRVAREKGALDSVEAARVLRSKGIDVTLRIAGTGDDLDEARSLSERHGLNDVVEFTGFIAGDDRIKAYRSSDVLLFPTYWNEGFPYVVLEAMAAGLPIVSTTHGVMPHLVRDGVNGFLVQPRDPDALAAALERLALDPERRMQIGRGNRREVQESYGIEKATLAYGQLYADLLSGGAAAASRGRPGARP